MYTINIAKAETSIEVDFAALPEVSREYIVNYGLTQALNDAVAPLAVIDGKVCVNKKPLEDTSADKFEEIVLGRVQKKLDALIAGTVRVAGVRVGDPVKAEAIEIAIDMTVRGEFKKAGKTLDAKAMRARAVELVGRNPAYMHLARARFDKRAEEAKIIAAMEAEMMNAGLEEKDDEPFGAAATFEANNPIT